MIDPKAELTMKKIQAGNTEMDAFLLCLPHLLFRLISMSSPSPSPSPLRKDLQLLLPLLITTTTTTTATITTIFNHQITTRANRPGVVEECLAIASLLTGVTTWVTTQVCIIIMFFITTTTITCVTTTPSSTLLSNFCSPW